MHDVGRRDVDGASQSAVLVLDPVTMLIKLDHLNRMAFGRMFLPRSVQQGIDDLVDLPATCFDLARPTMLNAQRAQLLDERDRFLGCIHQRLEVPWRSNRRVRCQCTLQGKMCRSLQIPTEVARDSGMMSPGVPI